MLSTFLLHPYIAGSLVAVYLRHWHFNPGKNALILDSKHQLDAALTCTERRPVQGQLEELERAASTGDADSDERQWTSLHAAAEPALDVVGGPTLEMSVVGGVMSAGIARSNILQVQAGSDFAAGLVKARLRKEFGIRRRPKDGGTDVERHLALLRQLLALQPRRLASTAVPPLRTTLSPQWPPINPTPTRPHLLDEIPSRVNGRNEMVRRLMHPLDR